jgi:hypothetical protein
MPRKRKPLVFEAPDFFSPAPRAEEPAANDLYEDLEQQQRFNQPNPSGVPLVDALRKRAKRNEEKNGLRNIYRKLRKGN